MTSIAARKQARRFYGTIGAAMRRTSRHLETRRNERTDSTTRRTCGFAVKFDERSLRAS
ncbi:MAG: hypothetical protein K2Y71_09600 [Xanthobacteraceae bacterium]|nr:hypothetical protein [Xanthobacteraceae bacterium]